MTAYRLAVVSGGLRQPSSTRLLADQLAAATSRALREGGDEASVEVVELRDHAHELANAMLTGFPGGGLREAVNTVVGADGIIAVTPVFTASYSGLFKSFFDVVEEGSLAGKPVLMAATGGTERHSLVLEYALRPLFAYLRSIVAPTGVYAASSDWGNLDGTCEVLAVRVERAATELAELVRTGSTARAPNPFDDPTPFAQLLTGG